MFPSVFQGGSELHIRMGTLHDCKVLGTSWYDIGKSRRRDKILCNRCLLKHEGRIGSDSGDAL